jgi:hypothetical protein
MPAYYKVALNTALTALTSIATIEDNAATVERDLENAVAIAQGALRLLKIIGVNP